MFTSVKALLSPEGSLFDHSRSYRGALRICCSSHLRLGLTNNLEDTYHLTGLLCVCIFCFIITGLHSLRLNKDYNNKHSVDHNKAKRNVDVDVTNDKHNNQKVYHSEEVKAQISNEEGRGDIDLFVLIRGPRRQSNDKSRDEEGGAHKLTDS